MVLALSCGSPSKKAKEADWLLRPVLLDPKLGPRRGARVMVPSGQKHDFVGNARIASSPGAVRPVSSFMAVLGDVGSKGRKSNHHSCRYKKTHTDIKVTPNVPDPAGS